LHRSLAATCHGSTIVPDAVPSARWDGAARKQLMVLGDLRLAGPWPEGWVMTRFRLELLGWLLVLVLCSGARGGLYYEQECSVSRRLGAPGKTVKQVCYVSGATVRTEVQAEGGTSTVIYRWDLGRMYHVMPQEKAAVEGPLLMRDLRADARVDVTKTGETRKIGQYTCTRHDAAFQGRTIHFWLTTELDLGPALSGFWGALGMAAVEPQVADELAKTAACPIMIGRSSSEGTATTNIAAVKVQAIPDSMVEVPEGYRTMSVLTRR